MQKNTTMAFWDHVYELRKRCLIVIASILIFSVVGYFLFPIYINMITKVVGETLNITNIAEGFSTRFNISFIFGVIVSIPVFFFELILFIFPALTKKEKFIFLSITVSSFILFMFGIIFAYSYVLPYTVVFFKSKEFIPEHVKTLISYKNFISFFFQFLLCFGICFQFPIVLVLLMNFKLLKVEFLIKNFKYFIIIIFIVAAVFTPDVFSQIMMAIPMLLLYSLTIIIAKIFKIGI